MISSTLLKPDKMIDTTFIPCSSPSHGLLLMFNGHFLPFHVLICDQKNRDLWNSPLCVQVIQANFCGWWLSSALYLVLSFSRPFHLLVFARIFIFFFLAFSLPFSNFPACFSQLVVNAQIAVFFPDTVL